jgi:hypothetical protein
MKYLIITALLLCSFSSSANYVLETIDIVSKDEICGDRVKVGDTITVLSNGGELKEAHLADKCIRDKKIKLVIMKALSAASYLSLFSDDVCLLSSSDIGTHTPYLDPRNVKVDETRDILRAVFMTLVDDAKIEAKHSLQYVGFMFLIPSTEMGSIPHEMFIEILGNKYKGVCK